jgi:hypothetical protein
MSPPRPTYPRLEKHAQAALLRELVERCTQLAKRGTPVVVFDLDGTLMDNRPRTCAILHECADRLNGRAPEVAKKLRGTDAQSLSYLLSDSLEDLGVHETEHVAEISAYWRERFFADDHLRFDEALGGAVEFTRACYDAGAVLVYLTGRDLPLMGIGSFRSLRDLGFPIGVPGTELVLKPDASMPDEAFKRLMAPKVGRVGKIVASFDNEPANCNIFLSHYPESISVLVDTQHMPGAPKPASGVRVIADFRM